LLPGIWQQFHRKKKNSLSDLNFNNFAPQDTGKMRYFVLLFLFSILFVHCNRKPTANEPDASEASLKHEALNLVKDHVNRQMNNAQSSSDARGILTISDQQKKVMIDPGMVFTGLIDEDEVPDAIASYLVDYPDGATIDEHLVLLNRNGCLEPDTSLIMNIQIIRLEKRKIIADFHTKSRNNPLYNCHTCTNRVTYRYSGKTLVEIE